MNVRNLYVLSSVMVSLLFCTSLFAQNQSYSYNRAPLNPKAGVQLPLGSIKARGWLRKQLELQKDGATGNAEALYPEASNLGPESDWLGGKGESWERAPYYVKGLVALAYTLDDAGLKAKAGKWINWTLDHQRTNGAFGPEKMKDWWPRMPMMYAIQGYYEATNDRRVIPFFTKYFNYQLENLDKDPLREWSKSRTGDNIELVLWLYNKTGDPKLLTLAKKLKEQAYPWAEIYANNQFYWYGDDFHTKHSVSVGQALKLPVVYAQLDSDPAYATGTEQGIAHLLHDHGQVTGIASGTEFLAGRSSFQGTETCTVVEWMQSLETAARIFPDEGFGDRLEKIAFNTLPAQFSRDIRCHVYYSQPNQLFSKKGSVGFDEDYEGGLLLSPYSGMGCCRYNMHMGWPYLVKNSWISTPDKGLAAVVYAPVEVNAFVAGGVPLKLNVVTNYPFEEEIELYLSLAKPTAFPLKLRVPAWCKKPEIRIDGKLQAGVKSGETYTINRTWNARSKVVLRFPMEVVVSNQVNASVAVERGPLVYALQLDAKYTAVKKHQVAGFFDYEIRPVSDWNYGLVIDQQHPGQSVKILQKAMPENPFDAAVTPVRLKLPAKKIAAWGIAYNQMHAAEVPFSPVASTAETEEVTLVPFGSENIRISNFPVVGTPVGASRSVFREDFSRATLKDWLLYGGSWYIRDGAFHSASNKGSWGHGIHGSKAVASGTNFSDLSYEANVQVHSGGNAGLIFRVSDAVIGANAYNGYYVGVDAEAGTIQLGKASGQQWILLGSKAYKLEKGKACLLRVEAKGSRIQVYVDHAADPLIVVEDSEFKTGAIGVRAYDALATVDDLLVISK